MKSGHTTSYSAKSAVVRALIVGLVNHSPLYCVLLTSLFQYYIILFFCAKLDKEVFIVKSKVISFRGQYFKMLSW